LGGNYKKDYDEEKVQFHSQAVINRMIDIYEEWYKTFSIEDIL